MKKIIYYIVFFIFNSVAVAVGQNNVDCTGNIQQNMDRFFAEAKKASSLPHLQNMVTGSHSAKEQGYDLLAVNGEIL